MTVEDKNVIPVVISERNDRFLYYCDGLVPECRKSICYALGHSDPVCYLTENLDHALTLEEVKEIKPWRTNNDNNTDTRKTNKEHNPVPRD